jgi:uroporphyrin-III C-methyltransferase/precorrin-2 dehydrogenase/sirohydrochlorin ferrochelatase
MSTFPADAAHNDAVPPNSIGRVYLVGAGPGDPELLTLRADRLLREADVVVYDQLVSPAVLERVGAQAEQIYVGKKESQHSLPQADINGLLVQLAHQGKSVVRLKGGDPFIFGRGGEEAQALVGAGVHFEVVPGVTAAAGVGAYAGIPLTHRDYAQSCLFTTGHLKDGNVHLDWAHLVRPNQTVVIYMGLGALAEICRQLVAHGQGSSTPTAVIENGTTEQQRVLVGTLADIASQVQAYGFKSPSLIIVGEVVRLREKLQWFEAARERENF